MPGSEYAKATGSGEGTAGAETAKSAAGPNPDSHTGPTDQGTSPTRGSLRRVQWHAQDRSGTTETDAADRDYTERSGGPLPHTTRQWVVVAAVAAVLVLIAGLATAAATSHGSGSITTTAAAAATRSTHSGASALVPLTSIVSPSLTSLSASPSHSPLTGPPTPSPLTGPPTHSAPNTARTTAAAAGSTQPQPIGWWPLNNGSGTVATDKVGHHNGVTTNTNWIGAAADFNGSNSVITVPEPIVDTGPGKSFTIAAWVYLRTASAWGTIVSQDGSVNSGFRLEYDNADNRWAFTRQGSDSTKSTDHRALSSAPPALNTWTPLVGVFDATSDELLLYVNGQLQGASTDPTPYATHGSLVFGRSMTGGFDLAWIPGTLGDIRVYDTALTNSQIHAIGDYQ
jgi:hypothetical protein